MSTFKTALRMALAHPFYLLIYTVFISLMGVFIAASVSWNSSQFTEYEPCDANVIVVDRDDSDLSRALTKHLDSRFDLVTGVGDDTYDLADARAKSWALIGDRLKRPRVVIGDRLKRLVIGDSLCRTAGLPAGLARTVLGCRQERNVPSCQVARHSFKSVPNEWIQSFKSVPND